MRTQSCPDFARLTLAALAVAASLGACKKEDAVAAPPAIGALAVVQGNNQSVQAGKELPLPVILRVVSTNGDAMAGIPVAIVVAEGGVRSRHLRASATARGSSRPSGRWALASWITSCVPRCPGSTR